MDHEFIRKKIENGLKFLKSKNFDKAIKCFEYVEKNKNTKLAGLLYLGIAQIEKGNNQNAINYFNKILKIDNLHEHANINLGLIYFREKKYLEAAKYFDLILKINGKHLIANLHKGIIEYNIKNFESAYVHFEICEKIDENIPQLYNYLGSINFKKNNLDQAIEYYKKAIIKNRNDFRSKYNLSRCYFSKFLYDEALHLFEFRHSFTKNSKADEVKSKFNPDQWNGEDLNNKSIIIISEQGIGDTIQYARYLFYLYETYKCKIYFYVNKKLLHLFNNCPFETISDLNKLNKVDYFQYIMSLQQIYFKKYKKFYKNINYINADKKSLIHWKKKIDKFEKTRIAIAWQGNPDYSEDHLRSIPLKYFVNIIKNNKYNIISLQKNFGSEQIQQNNFSKYINDFSNDIDLTENAFDDTIHILKNINLLITSDTALAHLAGTMEINTFLLLNFNPEWRWSIQLKDKCIYSTKLKIIKQKKYNDWKSAISELEERLNNSLIF